MEQLVYNYNYYSFKCFQESIFNENLRIFTTQALHYFKDYFKEKLHAH